MYRYYAYSAVCYAYLSDVQGFGELEVDGTSDTNEYKMATTRGMNSAWFSRGWTVQDLLAPSRLFFYDRDWHFIGERDDLAQHISSVNRMNEAVLTSMRPGMLGRRTQLIVLTSVAEKMGWAAKRQTIGQEDLAYCLLGLFDVNMPLSYGEGGKAFMRHQVEIIRKGADESIFAWRREAADLSSSTSLRSVTKRLHLKGWERAQIQEHIERERIRKLEKDASYEPKTICLH